VVHSAVCVVGGLICVLVAALCCSEQRLFCDCVCLRLLGQAKLAGPPNGGLKKDEGLRLNKVLRTGVPVLLWSLIRPGT
jgi:hypothetical protein